LWRAACGRNERLGVPLFERNSTGVRPTLAGAEMNAAGVVKGRLDAECISTGLGNLRPKIGALRKES
jgi:hypothetical protein